MVYLLILMASSRSETLFENTTSLLRVVPFFSLDLVFATVIFHASRPVISLGLGETTALSENRGVL